MSAAEAAYERPGLLDPMDHLDWHNCGGVEIAIRRDPHRLEMVFLRVASHPQVFTWSSVDVARAFVRCVKGGGLDHLLEDGATPAVDLTPAGGAHMDAAGRALSPGARSVRSDTVMDPAPWWEQS